MNLNHAEGFFANAPDGVLLTQRFEDAIPPLLKSFYLIDVTIRFCKHPLRQTTEGDFSLLALARVGDFI